MKSVQVSTKEQLLSSGTICNALAITAGLLANHGQQGVIDTRPKILAMLKVRDKAARSNATQLVSVSTSLSKA